MLKKIIGCETVFNQGNNIHKLSLLKIKILIFKLQGDPTFPPHQDMMAGWYETDYVTVGIAIDNATRQNGCFGWFQIVTHTIISKKSFIQPRSYFGKEWTPLETSVVKFLFLGSDTTQINFPITHW